MARTLVRGANVFDGTGSAPSVCDILIDGERFAAVGEGLDAGDAAVVDATGLFAMPGMIDCHVHVTLFGEAGLATYARMGVTTVKDLGGTFESVIDLRDRQRAGKVPGARVAVVGAFVEGDPPSWGAAPIGTGTGMEQHRTPPEVDATLARNFAAGVDGIKLYAGLPPNLVGHAIRTIGDRVPVTGHLTATTASEAVGLGIGALEHLQLTLYRDLVPAEHALGPGDIMGNPAYWGKVRRGWEEVEPRGSAAGRVVSAMAKAGTRMVPTLVLGARTDLGFTDEERAAFTPAQRERMAARAAGGAAGPPVDLARSAANMIGVIEAMHAGGVTLLPGTDCGAVGVPPGYGYHIELSLMAKAMPARDVLMAATSKAAAWLRRDDLGAIEPGRRADLVLLRGNPLDDIAQTRNIAGVYMDGQLVN